MAAHAGVLGPDPELLAQVSANSPWPFTHFGVKIEQDGYEHLGLELHMSLNFDRKWEQLGLLVADIRAKGLLAAQPREVEVNDVLIQVNEVHGDLVSMVDVLANKPVHTLYFVRVDAPKNAQPTGLGGKPPAAAPQALNKKKAKKGKVWKPKPPAAAEPGAKERGTVAAGAPEKAVAKGLGAEAAETSEGNLPKDIFANAAAAAQRVVPLCLSAQALLPAAA